MTALTRDDMASLAEAVLDGLPRSVLYDAMMDLGADEWGADYQMAAVATLLDHPYYAWLRQPRIRPELVRRMVVWALGRMTYAEYH